MTSFSPIDLSLLPAPQVVEPLDFEVIFTQRKTELISLYPAEQQADIAARLELESEPLVKLLQENAYRELIWRQRVNESALAVMLAFATDSDLDQIAARFNVNRLIITPANPTATPPVEAVLEGDDSLRERTQMALEGLSTAGPRNAYIFHARSADGRVADATTISPAPCYVTVTVQSAIGDGSADQDLLDVVAAALNDEDVRPVADRVTVQSATVVPYSVTAVLFVNSLTPESELVLEAARNALATFVNQRRRLDQGVYRSALDAALHVEGVRYVELTGWENIPASATAAPYCTATNVTMAELQA
ncbi:baseplate J/gp47 family protein [Pseudomonas sp. M30-35]|uniref:baseplate J/gp47 family protein n=1 Tax=Pseudomonas sp. M30-35 TaxID=1981174 RepID=UPI000B3CA632|nr:baseplate J/gp47 family protein [Pseudomonas sp. M30-35]ARU88286.1 baseplate assembly protein [Pseudomonas sp. M30-35]